ncbi:UNVERIFIED_CONTAM: hypothetical protein Sradi_5238200 [Sesamum radiatum]|uniref:Uncharacterized protein n=1 Tax=Sesamum radiatum TaxID=300843 RepID=A0AAW2LMT1_SESRA
MVICTKYYPNGDFYSGQTGTNPSFTWRSILAARSLLRYGMRWEVGGGKLIKVVGDPWLPRPPTFKRVSPPRSLPTNASVSMLLTEDRNWNQELLREEFSRIDS